MKTLQPLRIADVGLASGHVLGVARIDKEHGKSTGIEKFENWNPVDAGRFHNDCLDTTFLKPIYQSMQIGREGTEAAHWLRRAICPTAAMCIVAPISMVAAFGWTIGIVRSILDLDLFRFISNPPADDGGSAGLRNSSDS